MSDTSNKDAQEQRVVDNEPQEQVQEETGPANKNEENPMPSPEEEEAVIKKKYGGIIPKKKPLISKDHERAFFDSADWALGKQGAQKPKGPLEALRPKLQPTPHQQVRSRRSAYAPTDGEEIPGNAANEDHDSPGDDDKNSTIVAEDQSCHS